LWPVSIATSLVPSSADPKLLSACHSIKSEISHLATPSAHDEAQRYGQAQCKGRWWSTQTCKSANFFGTESASEFILMYTTRFVLCHVHNYMTDMQNYTIAMRKWLSPRVNVGILPNITMV
jgi:hypothetical protein